MTYTEFVQMQKEAGMEPIKDINVVVDPAQTLANRKRRDLAMAEGLGVDKDIARQNINKRNVARIVSMLPLPILAAIAGERAAARLGSRKFPKLRAALRGHGAWSGGVLGLVGSASADTIGRASGAMTDIDREQGRKLLGESPSVFEYLVPGLAARRSAMLQNAEAAGFAGD